MRCSDCDQEFIGSRCPCGLRATTVSGAVSPDWMITHCHVPGCHTAIRHRPGRLGNPACQWHQAGTAHVASAAPMGLPDPVYPWPWKSDREREEQARKAFWQARFRHYPALYARWLITPEPVPAREPEQSEASTGNDVEQEVKA